MPTRVELLSAEVVGTNPDRFDRPFTLRVVLNVLEDPPRGTIDVRFTWSPIWELPVDQELDELEVGPLSTIGKHDLMLECDPPTLAEIPDPTGPTALMVSLQYKNSEFLHLGFNVETSCTLAETPEIYTDPSVLLRKIGRCFRKATDIAWDGDEASGAVNEKTLEGLVAAAVGGADNRRPRHTTSIDDSDDSGDESSDEEEEEDDELPTKKRREEEPSCAAA